MLDGPILIEFYQSPQCTSGFTLGVVHLMDFDKCIMSCIHHCIIIQNSFTHPEGPCLHLFVTLDHHQILTVSTVLAVSECHIVSVTPHVASMDWLFSFNTMHASSSVSFLGFIAHFITEQYSIVWIHHSLFIHLPVEGHSDCSQL